MKFLIVVLSAIVAWLLLQLFKFFTPALFRAENTRSKVISWSTFICGGILGFLMFSSQDSSNLGSIFFFFVLLEGINAFFHFKILCTLEESAPSREEIAEKERRAALEASVRSGEWEFPYMEYFMLCKEEGVMLNVTNDFANTKRQKLAEYLLEKHMIPEDARAPYLEDVRKHLIAAEKELQKKAEEKKRYESTPKAFPLSQAERKLLNGLSVLFKSFGLEKRKIMLKNEIAAIEATINSKQQEIAGKEPTSYSNPYKEKDWATWGGIANGIAGPAAGLMTAMQVQQDNQRAREANAAYNQMVTMLNTMKEENRKRLYQECQELQKTKDALTLELEKLSTKIVFDRPDCKALSAGIKLSKVDFQKNESGTLSIQAHISVAVPQEQMEISSCVVDGVLHAQVYQKKTLIDDVYFAFPRKGLAPNQKPTELYSLCQRALPVDAAYTLQLCDDHNLWLMEK